MAPAVCCHLHLGAGVHGPIAAIGVAAAAAATTWAWAALCRDGRARSFAA
uniref:Uncharacterized protein n=1 Tax=Arundo donax TaxID=35708 RepID=A0A0A9BUA5_ARUDO